VMNAPIAAVMPSAGRPSAAATINGAATPIAQRSAKPGSSAERSKRNTVATSSRTQVNSEEVRIT
jgi:hypothetical protein